MQSPYFGGKESLTEWTPAILCEFAPVKGSGQSTVNVLPQVKPQPPVAKDYLHSAT